MKVRMYNWIEQETMIDFRVDCIRKQKIASHVLEKLIKEYLSGKVQV